jgi:hypothetical protein
MQMQCTGITCLDDNGAEGMAQPLKLIAPWKVPALIEHVKLIALCFNLWRGKPYAPYCSGFPCRHSACIVMLGGTARERLKNNPVSSFGDKP